MVDDLIAALEKAEAGSQDLDYRIYKAAVWKLGMTTDDEYVPPYTTSLDAALPWENIEEVALHDIVEDEPLGMVWEAWHVAKETGRRTMGAGHTEALARRIAALRARQEGGG